MFNKKNSTFHFSEIVNGKNSSSYENEWNYLSLLHYTYNRNFDQQKIKLQYLKINSSLVKKKNYSKSQKKKTYKLFLIF